ncbi:unnamed protein product [Ectocarpus sp. CCAP 1310/34]|nr:unnamed protein product [Ectocarpus sp. CCAP 1310/34]
MEQQTKGHAVMAVAAAAAAAQGPRRHGLVDLTPHSSAAAPGTSATGQGGAAAAPPEGGEANGAPENGVGKRAKPITRKTPVPLWKARDILLQAVSDSGGESEFLQAHSAFSSIYRGMGRERRSPPVSGEDVGDDFEHVFSIRLEVRSSHAQAGKSGGVVDASLWAWV